MRAQEHIETTPHLDAVVLNFDRSQRVRSPAETADTQLGEFPPLPRSLRPPDAKLARACNRIIVAIIALPFLLAILSLLRRSLFH